MSMCGSPRRADSALATVVLPAPDVPATRIRRGRAGSGSFHASGCTPASSAEWWCAVHPVSQDLCRVRAADRVAPEVGARLDEVRYCSAGCRRHGVTDTDRRLERTILDLLGARAGAATICPSE